MTKAALLLVIFTLPLTITGCGNSGSQQDSAPSRQMAADDTSKLCSSIQGTGLTKQCTVNSRDSTIHVMIDNNDDEVARNICADVANRTAQQMAHLSGQWVLQVYSLYRSDKPLATCALH
jgi:hypothetical protein